MLAFSRTCTSARGSLSGIACLVKRLRSNQPVRKMGGESTNLLKRWSVANNELPAVETVKNIHVYDFDNTLFASPLPNNKIWNPSDIGKLQTQEIFVNGGWWHDPHVLEMTGEGIEKEEPRAWEGWWNENIVELVRLSMEQKDVVNILLTGRGESRFADLIQRIVKSRGLHFHMICLKPEVGPANERFPSTFKFKAALLRDVLHTYTLATEFLIYEDRPKHVADFITFLKGFNQAMVGSIALGTPRGRTKPIHTDVIEVASNEAPLDPVNEVAQVQRMINSHNTAIRNGTAPKFAKPYSIKRTVFFTGYMVKPEDTARLLAVANLPQETQRGGDLRTLANNIMITPRPAPKNIIDKVGGMGTDFRWRVTALGKFEDSVWAARVEPTDLSAKWYTESPTPCIVLALRRDARPHQANRITNWQTLPQGQAFEIDTVVGEKVSLRLEEDRPSADNGDDNQARSGKRPRDHNSDFPPNGRSNGNNENRRPPNGPSSQRNNSGGQSFAQARRAQRQENRGGNARGRGGQGRGGSGNATGAGRNRGRGGYGANYRSLDDSVANSGSNLDGANDDDRGLTY